MKAIHYLLFVDCFILLKINNIVNTLKLTNLSIILILTQKDAFIKLYCH